MYNFKSCIAPTKKSVIFIPMKTSAAFAYFLTFRTYGTWLHGDERGSVSFKNNQFKQPLITPHKNLRKHMQSMMCEPALQFSTVQRQTVLQSIIQTCQYNHWILYAVHVRMEHVHLVLQSSSTKEDTQKIIKCYATKELKKHHSELSQRSHFWSRQGSTRNIWSPESLFPALHYVIKQQGEPMALFYDKKYYDLRDEQLYEVYLQ
jgi:REP element-mobilizing transposase RayT